MSANSEVFDPKGSKKILATMLGDGGEGAVYPLSDRPEVIVKWYHPEKLEKHGAYLQEKITAMSALSPHFQQYTSIKWPLMSVFNDNAQKNWIGYAMRRAEGVQMSRLAHPMTYQKHFPNVDRVGVVAYLISFLEAVETLHKAGVMIGDYNLQNVMCIPNSAEVCLIDCDSYQIQVEGKTYPCLVGSPDMTAPEQHGKSFEKIARTLESEAFSVAIILFKCLMLGRHPYDIVGGSDPVTNMRSGQFAYGVGNKGVPVGDWYNIWSHMPFRIKDLFITTFTEGAQTPQKRASIAKWRQELAIYKAEMQKGWHEKAIRPSEPKKKHYNGSRSLSAAM